MTSARSRAFATRLLITTPTMKSPKKVKTYSVSSTVKLKRGGIKKKSKASTPRAAVRIAGRRPSRAAASTTASWYIMTRLIGDRKGIARVESRVVAATRARLAR
ncbi:MAG: hypothetical protein ACD_75C00115G0003 [uncultured bacterium]|nr:MAG: hypothetical protein ACD_75C00115G0003 [uncultured bacterium]